LGLAVFWLPLVDTFRTKYFKEIMAFEPLVPAIRELLGQQAA